MNIVETKRQNRKVDASKKQLRNQVLTVLSTTTSGKALTRHGLEKIADRIMELFSERINAVDRKKATVWAAGEQEILDDLRCPR